jgi:hypothetical protein
MNQRSVLAATAMLGVMILGWFSIAQEVPPPPTAQPPGAEVMAQGPVHEAYAEPIQDQPTEGPVVPKQPPDPIEELPPDQKPEGDNVQWIPGYWAWDADSSNFLWVSGIWRDVPPGRQWVPGHWQEVEGGWVWVTGFWAPDTLEQVQYLPPPPPSVEAGPSAPAPDDTSIYVGGNWVYQGRFLWQPGHWIAHRPGWVWVPAYYVWTPVGCIFVEGHWDYPLDERGLLFAPCRFDLGVFLAARRPFIPAFVISPDFLLGALFVGPQHRNYYFGDFFEDRYLTRGFMPWLDYHPRRGMFDPNFAYFRQLHQGEAGWETSLRALYTGRQSGAIPRPPRTLIQQTQIVKNITINNRHNVVVSKNVNLTHIQNVTAITPLRDVKNLKVSRLGGLTPGRQTKVAPRAVKVQALPKEEHVRVQKAAAQARTLATHRREAEAKVFHEGSGIPVKHTDQPHTLKLPAHTATPQVSTPRPGTPPPVTPRVVPPHPTAPPHVEHAIPKYEPHRSPTPPKKEPTKKESPKKEKDKK